MTKRDTTIYWTGFGVVMAEAGTRKTAAAIAAAASADRTVRFTELLRVVGTERL